MIPTRNTTMLVNSDSDVNDDNEAIDIDDNKQIAPSDRCLQPSLMWHGEC